MIFFDTETCGYTGPAVLLQYQEDDKDIILYELWNEEVDRTLDTLEYLVSQPIIGFNLAFDWFQISKIYNVFKIFKDTYGNKIPAYCVESIAEIERSKEARQLCLKPHSACDLMLVSRRGPFQSLMDRKPIRIRKVPTLLVYPLVRELERQIQLPDIYFAKGEYKKMNWSVTDVKDRPDLKNLVLNFRPSGTLKNIYGHLYNKKDIVHFSEVSIPKNLLPIELGYRPYGGTWPQVIGQHISWWKHNSQAREYAKNDIVYTKGLWEHPEFGKPVPGDNNSELACLIGTIRWSGFSVDIEKLKQQIIGLRTRLKNVPTSPNETWKYIYEYLDPLERKLLAGSTKREVLEKLAKREGELGERCSDVLDTRKAGKRIELYSKLLVSKRFHASFNVVGTLSNRMSGTDGFNAQGIPRDDKDKNELIRSCFTFADEGQDLFGGDFEQFEVGIADAEFEDPILHEELMSGKIIHALFGQQMFPELSYDEIIKSKKKNPDYYDKGKRGVFGKIYGGDWTTLVRKHGIEEEVAKRAEENWDRKYRVMTQKRLATFARFQCMSQPNGIGTAVEWNEPEDYVECLLGNRRYFTLENKICKILFNIAQNPPKELRNSSVRVSRRDDRVQTIGGAVQSALYAAAFNVMSKNQRAAGNHKIQAPGASITKALQIAIWDHQPKGIGCFIVKPFNVHDEILCPVKHGHSDAVAQTVKATVESYKSKIPLIKMDWDKMNNWGEKK